MVSLLVLIADCSMVNKSHSVNHIRKTAINGSNMRDLDDKIRMKILMYENMSMSEIQSSFLDIPERTIFRHVENLVKSGRLEHKRIYGKHKRKRYTVKEEKKKRQDITTRAITEKSHKQIIGKITQTNLSELITQTRRFYKKELREFEKTEIDVSYYHYHVSMISGCLEWINRLTLVINSGMFENSPNKQYIAQRNRLDYEEFLQEICENIKAKHPKLGKRLIKEIYTVLVNLWFMEKVIG